MNGQKTKGIVISQKSGGATTTPFTQEAFQNGQFYSKKNKEKGERAHGFIFAKVIILLRGHLKCYHHPEKSVCCMIPIM